VTSLVISFALQDTLSGLASGFLLLGDAPFRPGDWIKVDDLEGRVVDLNWRSTRIETRGGDLVVVPNAHLANSQVTNWDEPSSIHRVVVPVQVAFSNPPTLAKEMLLDAARSTPGVLRDPAPEVFVTQVDDPLMGYEARLWVDDPTIAPRVASDFGSLVWYQSHRHQVPLPSPAFDLYTYDGLQTEEAARPDAAEVRRRLRRSPLFDSLGAGELELLAGSSHTARFQRGEALIDADATDRDLLVLWHGTAAIRVSKPDGETTEISQLEEGEVIGLLGRPDRWPYPVTVRAVDDCEVVVVPEQSAGEVTSRNPALSEALNQMFSARRRRVDRVMEQISAEIPRGDNGSAPTTDEGGPRTTAGGDEAGVTEREDE
jgi:CRP-like cAMP-binding protein